MFQRLNDVHVEGTGIGLAIVKKIIEGVGGRVWVESARGQGATFRFTWPGSDLGLGRRRPAPSPRSLLLTGAISTRQVL